MNFYNHEAEWASRRSVNIVHSIRHVQLPSCRHPSDWTVLLRSGQTNVIRIDAVSTLRRWAHEYERRSVASLG
ncbi:hypothetical protein FOPG_19387 [Fusarium oxysporum f. sp. conglutinans race 2 54008]|uniref:Uncharacterized protein n=1 Tax=Fusarium oxysporum f. sp. conglutinans race 2 54008 TaxID=1089457 RepID=X0GWS7_FUSOX|nr:hypothetical protein FOPG_19387 [Fusarium oxysporum f. sp. conglutinans race 2 54008]